MANPRTRPEAHTAEHLPIKPLLKASDVARILGCSRALVYRLAERGQLPCVRWECPGKGTKKPRSLVRFELERIREFVEDHRVVN